MTLSAAQLIYTNVEKERSSSGRDGYQVWLRTADALTESDLGEIQARLGDFEARDVGPDEMPVRHSYFTLSSGPVVVCRTVSLAESDRFNRSGRFYAHALILSPGDFRKLDNDPFAVIDQAQFQSTPEQGAQAADVAQGTISALSLQEQPGRPVDAGMNPEPLAALLPVVLHACAGDRPISIGVPGAPNQVLQLLRALMAWLPPALRLACSFDTLSTGRNLTQAPVLIAGLPASGPPRRYLNLLLFDPLRHSFAHAVPAATPGAFEQWLIGQLKRSPTAPPSGRCEAAFHLASSLDRGDIINDALSNVDADLFGEIACCDSVVPKLERLLRARLEADVGSVLAPILFALAFNWLRLTGPDALRALDRPLEPALLLRWLLTVYAQRSAGDIRADVEVAALKEVLEQTRGVNGEAGHLRKRLVLLYYRWGRRWSSLAKSLRDSKTISDDIYQWFVEWAVLTLPGRIVMGAGASPGGGWCGPQIVCTERSAAEECQNLAGALLGIDPLEHPGEHQALPPERWVWVLNHLLSLVPASERT